MTRGRASAGKIVSRAGRDAEPGELAPLPGELRDLVAHGGLLHFVRAGGF